MTAKGIYMWHLRSGDRRSCDRKGAKIELV
jgi:hypothetical protein